MDRRMEAVAVVIRDGMVWIEQSSHPEDDVAIMLHPSQIPLLVEWLQQATTEINAQ
jgi:hypothetical protein